MHVYLGTYLRVSRVCVCVKKGGWVPRFFRYFLLLWYLPA